MRRSGISRVTQGSAARRRVRTGSAAGRRAMPTRPRCRPGSAVGVKPPALPMAGASLLDEATAAAEAMTLAKRSSSSKSNVIYVADDVYPQTLAVLQTRAQPLGLEIKICTGDEALNNESFAVILQYPSLNGEVRDYQEWIAQYKTQLLVVIFSSSRKSNHHRKICPTSCSLRCRQPC